MSSTMFMLLSKRNFLVLLGLIVTILLLSTQALAKSKSEPIKLDEESWSRMLKGEWMVAFHAPWCPACKKLDGEWRKFADWSDDLDINVASADITSNPGLNGRFMVKGLPTIYHVKDGVFRIYTGPREHTALIRFIEEQGWKSVEPQSRFWNPDTLQMTFAAYSFRLSMMLRDIHDYLVEEVGLPYYVSFSLFAIGTVISGTILGLIIVFFIDMICPPKAYQQQQQQTATKRAKVSSGKSSKKDDSDLDDKQQNVATDSDSGSKSKSLRKRA